MFVLEEQKKNNLIYLWKAFAIFSVVCAHVSVEPVNSSVFIHLVTRLQSTIGTMGVPLFYFISGYLYFSNRYSFKQFMKKKIKTIIVPWFFCESIVWLYVVLRKGGISIIEWIKFMLGVYHSTYYLSILLILYLLFWKIRNSNSILIGSIVLSSMFIAALGWKVPCIIDFNSWTITPYLNVFNWMGYFSFGMLIKKLDCLRALVKISQKGIWITCPLLILDFAIHHYNEIPWTYFSRYALINITLQIMVVIGVSSYLYNKKLNFLMDIGKYSFSIYLLHELVVGMVVWITAKNGRVILIFARPFIVLLLVLIGIYFVKFISRKFVFLIKCSQVLFGIR